MGWGIGPAALVLLFEVGAARAQEPQPTPLVGEEPELAITIESLTALAGVALNSRGGSPAFKLEVGPVLSLIPPPSDHLDVDLRLPAGIGYQDRSETRTMANVSAQSFWVELVPTAELVLAITPSVLFVGGAGLGLAWGHTTVDVAFIGPQSDSAFAFILRLAAAGRFRLADGLWLEVQPLAINVHMGDGSSAYFAFLAGINVEL